MNTQQFIDAYNESRNGVNHFCRNPLYPKFLYSDGVQQCAEAGCYWLLDILGTELPAEFKKDPYNYFCIVTVTVKDGKAEILGEFEDDDPAPYRRDIDYTDMPEGEWKFFVNYDGPEYGWRCILPTEY